jgi:hypothetical protein
MALFFRDPIFSRLEDHLWKRAEERYLSKTGISPLDDVKEFKESARVWMNTWMSEERAKVNIARKEFHSIVLSKTSEALKAVLSQSEATWYSQERNYRPMILAVPYAVLQYRALQTLPALLAEKIQFRDMLPETLISLSEFATEKYFGEVIRRARKNYEVYKIQPHYNLLIVDVVHKDFYYLGDDEQTSRVDMLILSSHDLNIVERDKHKQTGEKQAVRQWNEIKNSTEGRPDSRRFTGEKWDLPDSFLQNTKK